MTLVEFLHPIAANSNRDKCLAVLYFKQRYDNIESMTAQQIQQALIQTRMPNAKNVNVPDVLAKSGALVDIVSGSVVPLDSGESPMRARNTSAI